MFNLLALAWLEVARFMLGLFGFLLAPLDFVLLRFDCFTCLVCLVCLLCLPGMLCLLTWLDLLSFFDLLGLALLTWFAWL